MFGGGQHEEEVFQGVAWEVFEPVFESVLGIPGVVQLVPLDEKRVVELGGVVDVDDLVLESVSLVVGDGHESAGLATLLLAYDFDDLVVVQPPSQHLVHLRDTHSQTLPLQ